MLEEALAGFFEDCCEHGTLLDVLAERGLAPTAPLVTIKPPQSGQASDWLRLPIWFVPNDTARQPPAR